MNQKFYGVSTPALMPDEMDTDMSLIPPRRRSDASMQHTEAELLAMRPGKLAFVEPPQATDQDLIKHSEDLEAARKVPGTQPAGDLYQSVFGAAEIPKVNKYTSLENVLHRALEQASTGKGAERHATGQDFENQPMQTISRLVGGHHGMLFQAIKKTQESTRMDSTAAVRELLGAINYLAGAITYLESPK